MHSLMLEINSYESIATILNMNEMTAGGRFMRKMDQYGFFVIVVEKFNGRINLIFC